MSVFQRVVLLIKVLVLLSVGTSAAWAHAGVQQEPGAWAVKSPHGSALMLAKSDSEAGDQGQGGSKGDDDSTTDDPDPDSDDDGDNDS